MDQLIRLEGKVYHVSYHALDRYCERVRSVYRPTAQDRERYSGDLRSLVELHGRTATARPEWIGIQPPDDEQRAVEAESWVLVGQDIAFPVVRKRRDFLIVTTLTRGELSTERRRLRNKIKADRRKARAVNRQNKSYFGERSVRWR